LREIAAEIPYGFELSSRRNTSHKTFWDKVTILHCEAHRPEDKQQPQRYSRHYYDLYKMLNSPVKADAMNNYELLRRTFEFKHKFYPQGFARYLDAIAGLIRLIPEEYRLKQLANDYAAMKEMIFGDFPSWHEIVEEIAGFEEELLAMKNKGLTE